MAKVEIRIFGGKNQLLVFPNKGECRLLKKALGLTEHTRFEGEITFDDQWQPYLRLEKKGSNERTTK